MNAAISVQVRAAFCCGAHMTDVQHNNPVIAIMNDDYALLQCCFSTAP